MHVDLGGYHIGTSSSRRHSTSTPTRWARTFPRPSTPSPTTPTVRRRAASGVTVQRGMTLDGLGKYLSQIITEGPAEHRGHRQDPEGHQDRCCGQLPAGGLARWPPSGTWSRCWRPAAPWSTAFRSSSAARTYWQQRFAERGLPVIGDDIKSQVGATITHRVLTRLFQERGVRLDRTYQLNFGGNTDFYEHAGAGAAGVQEDLQDQLRDQPARLRASARTTSTWAPATTCPG